MTDARKLSKHDLNRWVAEYALDWPYDENPHGWRLWKPKGQANFFGTIEDNNLPDFCGSLDACSRVISYLNTLGLTTMQLYAKHVIAAVYECSLPEEGFRLSWIMAAHLADATARRKCEALYNMKEHFANLKLSKESTRIIKSKDNPNAE